MRVKVGVWSGGGLPSSRHNDRRCLAHLRRSRRRLKFFFCSAGLDPITTCSMLTRCVQGREQNIARELDKGKSNPHVLDRSGGQATPPSEEKNNKTSRQRTHIRSSAATRPPIPQVGRASPPQIKQLRSYKITRTPIRTGRAGKPHKITTCQNPSRPTSGASDSQFPHSQIKFTRSAHLPLASPMLPQSCMS